MHLPEPRYLAHALRKTSFAAAVLAASALPAFAIDAFTTGVTVSDSDTGTADLFVDDNSVLDGQVCIGGGCTNTESFDVHTLLKMRSVNPNIEFHDTSSATFPDRSWKLLINDAIAGGLERFAVQDSLADTIPFWVSGGAPENALVVSSGGQVGIGTSMPGRKLHVLSPQFPAIRLERDASGGQTPYTWDIQGTSTYFALLDVTNNLTRPLKVYPGQPENALVLRNGFVGINKAAPSAQLHVLSDATGDLAGVGALQVENAQTTVTPRAMVNLVNNGRPEIIMANSSTGNEWAFGAGTNFVLKTGAIGSSDAAKTRHMKLFGATGNLEITGSIITGGPTCGAGCDAVFAEDYDLPSIKEHAAQMYALGHLPNVGPTAPGAPVNLTDHMGNMLNELEHAHIYIGQLEERLSRQDAVIAAMGQRLDLLESR